MHSGDLPKLLDAAAMADALLAMLKEPSQESVNTILPWAIVVGPAHELKDEDCTALDNDVTVDDINVVGGKVLLL